MPRKILFQSADVGIELGLLRKDEINVPLKLVFVHLQSSYSSFIFAISSLILNGFPLTFGNDTAGTR